MALRRLAVQPVHAHRAPRLDLGRLGLDQRDDVRDHVGVLYMVVGDARQIDHMLAVAAAGDRSEEHTSELQSLMRISYAVFCLKKKKQKKPKNNEQSNQHN